MVVGWHELEPLLVTTSGKHVVSLFRPSSSDTAARGDLSTRHQVIASQKAHVQRSCVQCAPA